MHAPPTGTSGESVLTGTFLRDLVGDASSWAFLFFLVNVLRPALGDSSAACFLRVFLADGFCASGVVDMSRSAVVSSSCT